MRVFASLINKNMLNSEPISFNDLAYYPQLILKRNKYSEEEILFLTGNSKNKTLSRTKGKLISLNKNPFNTIFLFTKGKCNIQIGLDNHALKLNDLIVIPENVAYHTSSLIENYGYCVHFKTEYLLPFLKISSIEDVLPLATKDSKYVVPLSAEQANIITTLFEEIYAEYDVASRETENIIRCYIEILLLKCKEYFQRVLFVVHHENHRALILARQFKALVEKKITDTRKVEDYANLLHISTKHLEKIISETLGTTPKQLIHDTLLREAKILLKQTDKTISEVAHHLKFIDQSYFSRFFKKHTLITPQEYREMV